MRQDLHIPMPHEASLPLLTARGRSLHPLIMTMASIFLLIIPLSLSAQAPYPTSSYTLSDDGTTLTRWNGSEKEVDLSADPAFDKVTKIAGWAFSYKKSLERVTLPNKLEILDKAAFSDCASLSEIGFNASLKTINYKAFFRCAKLTELTIPMGVTSIDELAFGQCSGLTKISLPASLTTIGTQTFYNCTALQSITCLAQTPPTAKDNTFDSNCCATSTLFVPEASLPLYKQQAPWSSFVHIEALQGAGYPTSSYELSDDKETLIRWTGPETEIDLSQDKAFSALKTIGNEAFKELTTLTSIIIPEGVKKIEISAFEGCASLALVQLPTSLTQLGTSVFRRCAALPSIALPESISSLPAFTFEECTSLATISFSSRLTVIGSHALASCKSLKVLTLPGSVTYIDQNAFVKCDQLSTLICYAVTPPTAHQAICSQETYDNCILLVPAPALESYRTTAQWSNFKSIQGIQAPYPTSSYRLSEDKKTLIRWLGEETDINMSTDPAFAYVTTIGESAFYELETLVSITLPNGVTTIERQAFVNCLALTDIKMPSGVSQIGEWAFSGCAALTKISLPSSLTELSKCLFAHSKALKEVILPSGLKKIGTKAFFECEGLKEIALPNGVTTIADFAFSRCRALEAITIPESLTQIEPSAFAECSALKKVNLPETFTTISPWTFSQCTSLTTIELPAALNKIGDHAFAKTPLEKITVKGNVPPTTTKDMVDDNIYTTATLYVPEEAVETYKKTAPWSAFLKIEADVSIHYPESSYTLSDDKTILIKWLGDEKEIDLTADPAFAALTTIGNTAFEKKEITSIVIPNTVHSIEAEAFSECAHLAQVTLSNTLEEIGQFAFYKCNALERITLPASLKRIGKWAFFTCAVLTDVVLPENLEFIAYKAYSECPAIKEITIPNSVTDLDMYAFAQCTGLERVTFGDKVKDLGTWTFNGCSALKEVVLPPSIEMIGEAVFRKCRKLPNLTLPASVKEIGNLAFSGCEAMTDFVLPEAVSAIGNRAFSDCAGLKRIVIPAKTKWIGDEAFKSCLALDSVICHATTPPTCSNAPFEAKTYAHAVLRVPDAVVKLYAKTQPWSNFKLINSTDSERISSEATLSIATAPGKLSITGATSIVLYSLEGTLIVSIPSVQREDTTEVALPQGSYLLYTDAATSRIIMVP